MSGTDGMLHQLRISVCMYVCVAYERHDGKGAIERANEIDRQPRRIQSTVLYI